MFINNLTKVIINLVFTLDPDVVIIGGAVSKNSLFLELIEKRLQSMFKKINLKIKFSIKTCKYFNDSNLIGANILAKK